MKGISIRQALGAMVLLAGLAEANQYAVIVHEGVPTTNISAQELRKVFLGEKQHWGSTDRILLSLPATKLPEHKFLLASVLHMDDSALAKHWVKMVYRNKVSRRPKPMPSVAVMLRVVATKPGAIAIIDASHLPEKHSFKILTVDGKLPRTEGYALVDNKDTSVTRGADVVSPRAVTASAQADDRVEQLASDLADLQMELAMGSEDEDFRSGPILDFSGFGHVSVGRTDTESGDSSAFSLGGLDLFITSQLSEKVSFLNETVFEPTEDGENVLDVERLLLKYDHSDALSVSAGRFHTTIGAWNDQFHHGEWLQTSIGRPTVLNFEDEDGILPIHLVGLVFKGARSMGSGDMDYTFEFGNGRGPTPDPPQLIVDANDAKAANLTLGFSPGGVQGLRVGGGYYMDRIPANTIATDGPLHGALDENIISAFVTYSAHEWEVLAEFLTIDHDGGASGDSSSDGYYAQVGRRFGAYTPYLRFDAVELDDSDTFFASVDNVDTFAAGLRYDWTNWAALKVQYDFENIDVAGGGMEHEQQLAIQLSFAF